MSEVRLIDANALKEDMGRAFWERWEWEVICKIIDNAPTVEPDKIQAIMSDYLVCRCEPQRPQGEWVVDEDNGILKYMKCSNCSKVAEWLDGGRQLLSNFCPTCGADMRGEDK